MERVQLNPIQDAIFCGGGGQKGSLPKICHTYPTMIKLGTIIAYPKKIQKLYESPKFCWRQHILMMQAKMAIPAFLK